VTRSPTTRIAHNKDSIAYQDMIAGYLVQNALAASVSVLSPCAGQASALVQAVTRCLRTLHTNSSSSSSDSLSTSLLAAPLAAVLDALPVDLTTAAAVAAAAEQLLSALGSWGQAVLLPAAAAAEGGEGLPALGGNLAVVLGLYVAVLRWARCWPPGGKGVVGNVRG
jgi:hypothetical protein